MTNDELRALLAEALPYIKAKAEQDHEFMGHKINTEVLPAARLVSSITAALAEKGSGKTLKDVIDDNYAGLV